MSDYGEWTMNRELAFNGDGSNPYFSEVDPADTDRQDPADGLMNTYTTGIMPEQTVLQESQVRVVAEVVPEPYPVPADKADWDVPFPGYDPPEFTSSWVRTTGVELGVSDPESPADVDFSQRPSLIEGGYTFDEQGFPCNPAGRQGIKGRGDLAKWGPNQAADPVVIAVDPETNARMILLVRRQDTGQWALPGGMVDPGEKVSVTARRELQEETGIDLGDMEGEVMYEGYVDDPRQTDCSWMESTARRFDIAHVPQPRAGDDATEAQWFSCDNSEVLEMVLWQHDAARGLTPQPLYASHGRIIREALRLP